MRYTDAIKLHKGDEVMFKKTGDVHTVLSVRLDSSSPSNCFIYCDNGKLYHHTEVK